MTPRTAHHHFVCHSHSQPRTVGRVAATHTRRLSDDHMSESRHAGNIFVARVGPQLDRVQGAACAVHRALLFRDGTRAAAPGAESMLFCGGMVSWRVNPEVLRCGGCRVPGAATGPEMGQKQFRSATSRGSQCPCGPNNSSSSTPVAPAQLPSAGSPARAGRPVMRSAPWSRTSWCGSDRSPRCAAALPVGSTVLLRGGVASWEQSRISGAHRQIARLQNSAAKISRPIGGEDYSASSPSTLTRDRRLSSYAASRATATASAPFTTGLPAAPMRRCPSSSRCSATFSLTDGGLVSARLVFISCVGGAAAARQPHKLKVTGSSPVPATSSGGGLGIQQPGSMTRGFASQRQPPSGRADESAMCPAAARFIDVGAA